MTSWNSRRQTVIFSAGLILALFLAAPACGDDDDDPPVKTQDPSELVGQTLPQLNGTYLATNAAGALSDAAGKPILISFWLNTCPDCQTEIPEIQALGSKLTGVALYSVAIDDPGANGKGPAGYKTPKEFVDTLKITMPALLVPRKTADSTFHLWALPTVVLANSSGMIEKTFTWPFTTADVEAAARALK